MSYKLYFVNFNVISKENVSLLKPASFLVIISHAPMREGPLPADSAFKRAAVAAESLCQTQQSMCVLPQNCIAVALSPEEHNSAYMYGYRAGHHLHSPLLPALDPSASM